MCLYPKLILNRKYIGNKKNGGIAPTPPDPRVLFVPVGCGKCMECKKQRTNNWRIRLMEEIRTAVRAKFVTMTFSEKSLIEIEYNIHKEEREKLGKANKKTDKRVKYTKATGYELDNKIATYAVRHFLERYRKKYRTSIKHWLVTELGGNNTERLHIHGIIWTNEHEKTENKILTKWTDTKPEIEHIWKYGTVNRMQKGWEDNYVNEITVNYIVKYINKTDDKHKLYNPIILTSAGIGKNYINRPDSRANKFKGEDTKTTYSTRQGIKLGLPIYYRNKIYTEKEREQLWINLLNKEERWVDGLRVSIKDGEEDYNEVVKRAREVNRIRGFGTGSSTEEQKKYEKDRRNLQRWIRHKKESRSDDMGIRKIDSQANKQSTNDK